VRLDAGLPAVVKDLASDPQTSGGLLVSCDPAVAEDVLAVFREGGFGEAAVIGRMTEGSGLQLRP